MERFLALLLASALGGAAGGFLVQMLGPAPGRSADVSGGATPGYREAFAAELQGIERRLAELGADAGPAGRPTLRGAPPASPTAEGAPPMDEAWFEALSARLVERMEPTLKKVVAETVVANGPETPEEETRKRVSLAEAAKQLQLSTSQEEQLRELYGELESEAFTLLAGKDGDPEEVRRDVDAVKADPSKSMEVIGKYIPKALGNIGGFITLETKRQQRTQEIVGPEKAERMRRELSIEEQNPLGIGGDFNFGAGR